MGTGSSDVAVGAGATIVGTGGAGAGSGAEAQPATARRTGSGRARSEREVGERGFTGDEGDPKSEALTSAARRWARHAGASGALAVLSPPFTEPARSPGASPRPSSAARPG